MIKLKPVKQSKGYCGPTSLQMVLSYYGINKSQSVLAKLTKTSRIKGCTEKNMIKTAKHFGLRGFIKQKSSIKELKSLASKNKPVIVDWFSPEEEGHYSVVAGFKKDNIFLADPHFGTIQKHKIKWFEERWWDQVGKHKIIREIIVIEK